MPSAHAVNQYANEAYATRLLHHMEILILSTLDWSLTATTGAWRRGRQGAEERALSPGPP